MHGYHLDAVRSNLVRCMHDDGGFERASDALASKFHSAKALGSRARMWRDLTAHASTSVWVYEVFAIEPDDPRFCEMRPFFKGADLGCTKWRSALLLNQLNGLRERGDDYDGYEGRMPSTLAIDDAITFYGRLPAGLKIPRAGASPDGEIGLFWEGEDYLLDLGFYGDGTYTYFARRQGSDNLYGNELPMNAGPDGALLDFLKTISG